jgi:hypothetical protein
MLRTADVFGIRTTISEYSYVDRGKLDSAATNLSQRDRHIAIRGESKSGKSWLRQKVFPESNIVQCRLNDDVKKIYIQILANLEISITSQKSESMGGLLSFAGTAEFGWKILAKANATLSLEGDVRKEIIARPIGQDELDIAFITRVIKASHKRVIIEDFHYLSEEIQRELAHELKTLWDYGIYVIVVGVWHRNNYLTFLNPDLAGRIEEIVVEWSNAELSRSFELGCRALNLTTSETVSRSIASDSYNNIGILQTLAQNLMDEYDIRDTSSSVGEIDDIGKLTNAGMTYANQLEAVYSLFTERVSEGIRKRKEATGIYAYALWAILESSDEDFKNGLSLDWIFAKSYARQPRIQKQNLRRVLQKFKELQADANGKGLVITFDDTSERIIILDKGLLFYRKYSTRSWPWETMAMEAGSSALSSE